MASMRLVCDRSVNCRERRFALRRRSGGRQGRTPSPQSWRIHSKARSGGSHPFRRRRIRAMPGATGQAQLVQRRLSHDANDDTGAGRLGHGGAGQGHLGGRREHRHHQEALRLDQSREHGRQPPRLPRDAVPLQRGDEEPHLRRDPLRRDDPPEGQGRHAAAQGHRGVGRAARHQGRRRHQAAPLLSRGADHRGPRRARQAHRRLRRAGREVRQVARRHRHRPQHALLQLHQRQRAGAGPLRGAVRGGRAGADRRAGGADGRRARHRHLREDHRVGAQGGLRAALLRQGSAREDRAQAQHGDRRQEVREAKRAARRSPSAPSRS